MIAFKKSSDLRIWLEKQRSGGKSIGFVPTMGALHEGHIHLITECKKLSDLCVCSIFVNPAQFNDPRDFEKYPVSLEKDIEMLARAGNDVLFLPSVLEVYPGGQNHLEKYDLGALENILEGFYRPGHFQGVCQVMSRLLRLVAPDKLFMGQKDYQQCLVVRRLIDILQIRLEFHTVPTVRDDDGLAKSSRNRRLTEAQREDALTIARLLTTIRKKAAAGPSAPILDWARKTLENAHFRTDYVSIARASDLQPIEIWDGREQAVALVAAFQGEVRLIDNMLLN